MDEKTVTMMEGVAREWRVRVMDSAGNVLNPEGFSFYGAAADGMQVPRRMQVHVEGDVAVLRLPGLWMSGRCWRYQVMCQDVLTGVEWVLCQGDVVLERRVACNGPALHEDAVLVDVVLDSELYQVEVYLGDSTVASAEAARLAEAAREGAEAGAARSVDAAAKAEALKGVALDAAAKAALSAEGAEDSKRLAVAAARDAVADAQLAEVAAAEAEASREAAEADVKLAGARAAEADASAKVAADAVSEALAARDEAAAARGGAEDAMRAAGARAGEAEDSAEAAEAARAGAEAAQVKAEAAQSSAEEQAAIATAAAEAAQAPESIAAQAARPATMVLLKDELLAMLGDAALFDLDTDGQKIIVHTDRLDDETLAQVEDMLWRFVPQFIDVESSNYLPMQRIMKKLPPLLDSALGGDGRHNLNYDEAAATVAVDIAYPNLDDESAAQVDAILAHELPPEVSGSGGYGVTPYLVDYLVSDFVWNQANVAAVFPEEKYEQGFALPRNMPFPAGLDVSSLDRIFYGVNITAIPDSWTFDKLVYGTRIFDHWESGQKDAPTLTELPEDMSLPNLTTADATFGHCKFSTLPEGMTLNKLTSGYRMFDYNQLTHLPEGMTLPNLTYGPGMFDYNQLTHLPEGMTLDKLTNGYNMFRGNKLTHLPEGMTLDKLTSGFNMFRGNKLTHLPEGMTLAGMNNAALRQGCDSMFLGNRIEEMPEGMTLEGMLYIDGLFQDNPLRKVSSGLNLSSVVRGYLAFSGAQLERDSALRVLNTLAHWDDGGQHYMTIGIHDDHKGDDEVLEAIAEARRKGWELSVQWNGTPTAQAATTYGLRKPPIYAKVSEMVRPDGTTERALDWGHYVTNWEERGYETFRSVEVAREYFGLPEENLT